MLFLLPIAGIPRTYSEPRYRPQLRDEDNYRLVTPLRASRRTRAVTGDQVPPSRITG